MSDPRPLRDHLAPYSSPMPDWLRSYQPGAPFCRADFFSSRVVFYPGSGGDGHPVELFGSSGLAHCFVYVDHLVPQESIQGDLEDRDLHKHFSGYHTLTEVVLQESDLTPRGWSPHVRRRRVARSRASAFTPYGLFVVLQRDEERDEGHGPTRLAILFLGGDGFASYDALFCQGGEGSAPHAAVIQDHGFSGNYSHFGHGGLLAEIASKCGVFPDWLFVAKNSKAWSGYQLVPELPGDRGGMYQMVRRLYRRSK